MPIAAIQDCWGNRAPGADGEEVIPEVLRPAQHEDLVVRPEEPVVAGQADSLGCANR